MIREIPGLPRARLIVEPLLAAQPGQQVVPASRVWNLRPKSGGSGARRWWLSATYC